MTRKNDRAYATRRKALEHAEGQLTEARKREHHHRDEAHCGYGTPDESLTIGQRLSQLRERLALGDENGVQQVIFDLGATSNCWQKVPDEVVEALLTILREPAMSTSHLSGHVLNYFEFESSQLTPRQKRLCMAFIDAHGSSFSDVFAVQVVSELREGLWLR